MAIKTGYNYGNIETPYDDLMQRSSTQLPNIDLGAEPVRSPYEIGEDALDGKTFSDMTLSTTMQSEGYISKKRGFMIDGRLGYIECMQLYVGTGGIIGGSLDIPDTLSTNSFHVDAIGNTWWGANNANAANAPAYILNTGEASFSNITISMESLTDVNVGVWITPSGISGIVEDPENPGTYISSFELNSATGSATFSGDISASTISGGEITGANIDIINGGQINLYGAEMYIRQSNIAPYAGKVIGYLFGGVDQDPSAPGVDIDTIKIIAAETAIGGGTVDLFLDASSGIVRFNALKFLPNNNGDLGRTDLRWNRLYADGVQTFIIIEEAGTSYTPALTDYGKMIILANTTPITITIPTNSSVAYPIGTQLDFFQAEAGSVTFGGAGVTILSKNGDLSVNGQYVGVSLIKRATDTWILIGDLTT